MKPLSQQFLDEQRTKLLERRETLVEDLRSFAHKNPSLRDDWETTFPSIGENEDENAQEIAMYINDLPVEYTLESDLKKVNNALQRIQNGTYGQCQNCKNAIDKKRLRAVPEAEQCIRCT